MQARSRKVAVFAGAAALAGGAAAGLASQDGADAATASPAAIARPAGAPPGMDLDAFAEALAEELGLPAAKVRAALEAVGPPGHPGGPPPDGASPPDGAAPPDGETPPASTGSTGSASPA